MTSTHDRALTDLNVNTTNTVRRCPWLHLNYEIQQYPQLAEVYRVDCKPKFLYKFIRLGTALITGEVGFCIMYCSKVFVDGALRL